MPGRVSAQVEVLAADAADGYAPGNRAAEATAETGLRRTPRPHAMNPDAQPAPVHHPHRADQGRAGPRAARDECDPRARGALGRSQRATDRRHRPVVLSHWPRAGLAYNAKLLTPSQ